jgi:hypothetical protein
VQRMDTRWEETHALREIRFLAGRCAVLAQFPPSRLGMCAPLMFVRSVLACCLLLAARGAVQPAHGALLVNVGLPRTGTSSVHEMVSLFNFSSVHVAFLRSRYDVEDRMGSLLKVFRATGGGNLRKLFDRTDVVSDTPCFGIIPALKAFMPHVTLVATTRSMESWLGTMRRNPGAGGCVRACVRACHLISPICLLLLPNSTTLRPVVSRVSSRFACIRESLCCSPRPCQASSCVSHAMC